MSEKTEIGEFYDLADQHMREERYEEAIELYRKLADINPENDSIVMSLAWAYRDSGRLSDAVLCLEKLLEKELKRKVFTGFAFDDLVKIYRNEGKCISQTVIICSPGYRIEPDRVFIGQLCIIQLPLLDKDITQVTMDKGLIGATVQ